MFLGYPSVDEFILIKDTSVNTDAAFTIGIFAILVNFFLYKKSQLEVKGCYVDVVYFIFFEFHCHELVKSEHTCKLKVLISCRLTSVTFIHVIIILINSLMYSFYLTLIYTVPPL